jgi:hypothetical protein
MFSRKLHVEPGADFEQRTDPAAQDDLATCWRGNSRQDLEQGALAGAIATDQTEGIALCDLEADVVQCEELMLVADPALPRTAQGSRNDILQASTARGAVDLCHVRQNDRCAHTTSAIRRSSR